SDDNLLLEVGIDDAYSYTKGCYLGQEVVERIRSRGHVNRKLCGLTLEGSQPAESGTPLYAAEKEVGHITSSVVSPRLRRVIALGYVHRDFWQPGTELSIHRDGSKAGATVTPVPFGTSP
ncbi:MAG TPA: glycine cleavage T C-terminal barrel domain-containing protein, partial [Candidatus Binatia bacterium]